jgi:signal transduction histidine kinase
MRRTCSGGWLWPWRLSAAVSVVAGVFAVSTISPLRLAALVVLLIAGLVGVALARAGRVEVGRHAFVLLMLLGYLAMTLPTAFRTMPSTLVGLWILAWLAVLVVAAGLLLGRVWALAITVAGVAALIFALVPGVGRPTNAPMSGALVLLSAAALVVFAFALNLVFEAIARARAQGQELQRSLWQTRATLEGQVEERTRALALAARVGRQLTRIHDLDTLLNDAVEMIRDRFELYHVQVYLLNPVAGELLLSAATGEAGAELLRDRHRLPVGPGSINGTAAANRQPVVVAHARTSPIFLSNPLLPNTESEAAIPMIVEDEVLGILDLHSDAQEGLNTDNLPVFTVLAAQLATAIRNARLFAEITETREQLARQAEMLTHGGWQRFLDERPAGGALGGATIPEEATRLSQPIAVRGATIGLLELNTPAARTPAAHELVAAVAGQLGAHLENLRLTQQAETALDDARQRESEMALINRLVTLLAAAPDLTGSLQIIVDELAQATSIGQVGIAMLNEERTALTVLADRSGSLNAESAVGFVIPLANNPATQLAIAERRPVIVEHATESPLTASAHEVLRQRGVKTILILPLVVENEVIGTVGLDVVEEGIELAEEQMRLAETIVYQAATAVQRARLFNETEQARRDAERLYTLSATLNTAQNLDEILGAVVASDLAEGASGVDLAIVDSDTAVPAWITLAARWPDAETLPSRPNDVARGARFSLPVDGRLGDWLAQPDEPLLFANLDEDESPEGTWLAAGDARAAAILPLQVADRWVGLMALLWPAPRRFGSRDRQLYRSMASQLAVALSNQQLYEQARARARQLEVLSRMEADMSLATTEDEILLALANGAPWGDGAMLDLTYLSSRASDGALLAEPVSRRHNGATVSRPANSSVLLRALPLSSLWLDQPREVLIIADAARDPRLDQTMQTQARREGWQAMALLPLRRGGQWQGYFSISWPTAHELSADEAFVLERLHEPLAATVAGRRAYLAQRVALAQTEALYTVSARLNVAQSYDDVLAVIHQHTELGRAADVLQFAHFDRPWMPDQTPEIVNIPAQWQRDEPPPPPRRLRVEDSPVLPLLRADRPSVFADIQNDPRLDRAGRAALREPGGVRSAVFAPLVVGGQWIGYVGLLFRRRARNFAEEEIESLAGVVGQVAVAAQTILLLEQTRQLLGSEQRQRRIADTLLNSARIMSESLDETVLRDQLAMQLCETVPGALFVNLYEWQPADGQFRLDRRVESPDADGRNLSRWSGPIGALFASDDRPELWQPLANGTGQIQTATEARGEFYRLPWRVGRAKAGILEVFRTGATPGEYPPPLTADDLRRCEGIIQQAALAIQNAQSYGQTQAALANQARLSGELRAVADVSIATAATLDADRLLAAAADLTRASFDLYHAHIYLLDDARETLVLRAGSGEIGRRMLREGRQIPLDARSIVARAAREHDVVVVPDVLHSPDFLPHPLLPQTRSEMAVPLIVGERLLGVLDVQAEQPDRFQPDDVLVHKILGAQLAVATQNAYYFAEQLRTAEQLREVDRLKTDFLARMSHELRTPLNSIIGFADVLLMGLDGDLTERMVEDLQLIRSSGYHLRDIIGDILDMSKIEAGRLELIIEPFDVERIAGELMATAAPLAEQKGLTLKLDIARDVGPLVADRTRVRQVLWNLIGNAIKFTDRGQIAVRVRRDNGEVLFTVTDTGIGIAAEHLPRIFDQFNQINPGRRGSISGTGLGLSISKSLVELHGGHIWVESQPGQGSAFHFALPARAANPTATETAL